MKSDSFIYLHWNVFFLMDSVQILSCIKGSFGTRTHTHALTNTHTHRRETLLGGASCYEGQQWARNRQQVEGCGCSWCGGVSRQLRHLLLIWMRLVLTFKPTFLFFLFTSFPVSSLLYLFFLVLQSFLHYSWHFTLLHPQRPGRRTPNTPPCCFLF